MREASDEVKLEERALFWQGRMPLRKRALKNLRRDHSLSAASTAHGLQSVPALRGAVHQGDPAGARGELVSRIASEVSKSFSARAPPPAAATARASGARARGAAASAEAVVAPATTRESESNTSRAPASSLARHAGHGDSVSETAIINARPARQLRLAPRAFFAAQQGRGRI